MSLLAAADAAREASPIALVVILGLGVAVVLLIRSMNRHLRRVPPTFPEPDRKNDTEDTKPADPS